MIPNQQWDNNRKLFQQSSDNCDKLIENVVENVLNEEQEPYIYSRNQSSEMNYPDMKDQINEQRSYSMSAYVDENNYNSNQSCEGIPRIFNPNYPNHYNEYSNNPNMNYNQPQKRHQNNFVYMNEEMQENFHRDPRKANSQKLNYNPNLGHLREQFNNNNNMNPNVNFTEQINNQFTT